MSLEKVNTPEVPLETHNSQRTLTKSTPVSGSPVLHKPSPFLDRVSSRTVATREVCTSGLWP